MCFKSSKNGWHVYDNDPQKPAFDVFDVDDLKNYLICLTGYVHITEAKDYKLGKSFVLTLVRCGV